MEIVIYGLAAIALILGVYLIIEIEKSESDKGE